MRVRDPEPYLYSIRRDWPRLSATRWPQGEWLCTKCEAGGALPPPRLRACTLRERYLGGEAGLELIRIKALWRDPDPELKPAGFLCRGQWYDRPESTHCGRKVRPGLGYGG